MNVKQELVRGLTSDPKHIPVWYRYDKQGSLYNDMCLEDPNYYLHRSELSVLHNHVHEIADAIKSKCSLIDLGSGNSAKSRFLIDALLNKQGHLNYIPVDISTEFLAEVTASLTEIYDTRLSVSPIYGDYDTAINKLNAIEGNKFLVCFGSLQSLSLDEQDQLLRRLSENMDETDRLLISLDVTNNAEDVRKAYIGSSGDTESLFFNAIWRLNKEYNGNMDLSKFQLIREYHPNTCPEEASFVTARLRSIGQQTVEIRLTVHFRDGEFLNLYERDGVSCKYTAKQILNLATRGNFQICRQWLSADHHVMFSCMAKV